jgi:hypothetical protein
MVADDHFDPAVSAANCSPITGIFNSSTRTDWHFMSVNNKRTNSGACTGAAGFVMSFDITAGFPSADSDATNVADGPSGVVVYNVSQSTEVSGLYFANLVNSTGCASRNGSDCLDCAIQLRQSRLQ